MYNHYLGKNTLDELISLISKMILTSNLSDLKYAKYSSVILDCTPDIFHSEKKGCHFKICL